MHIYANTYYIPFLVFINNVILYNDLKLHPVEYSYSKKFTGAMV